jgi:Protein of unknown function (DUF4058)
MNVSLITSKGAAMPLMDHFRPPLAELRHWESFHAVWSTEIMAMLNCGVLPEGYFAEAQVHVGGRAEIDVASFTQDPFGHSADSNGGVAVTTYSPPLTTTMLPLVFPDEIEIQVFSTTTGPTLVSAIELVSPANKDRPDTRRAFAAKCASYLHQGIGLVVIDVVTDRHANLHNELIDLMRQEPAVRFPGASLLYAVSYHPARLPSGVEQAETCFYELALDRALPIVPLPLRGGPTLPLDLESAYVEARGRSRL